MPDGIVKSVFWNTGERRLRAGWRILLLFLATLAVSLASARLAELGSLSFSGARLVYLVLAALALWGIVRWVDRRRLVEIGFEIGSRWWRDLAFGSAAACLAMALVFLVATTFGQVRIEGWPSRIAGFSFWVALAGQLAFTAFAATFEEAFCRGYLMRNLTEGLRRPPGRSRGAVALALAVSSLLFGLMHAGNPGATALSFLNLVLLGGLLGWAYQATGSLAMPIGLHLGWNFAMGNLFGFPVSGTTTDTTIVALRENGHPLWTGGGFGPEAGLSGLFLLVVLGLLVFLWSRSRREPEPANHNFFPSTPRTVAGWNRSSGPFTRWRTRSRRS